MHLEDSNLRQFNLTDKMNPIKKNSLESSPGSKEEDMKQTEEELRRRDPDRGYIISEANNFLSSIFLGGRAWKESHANEVKQYFI
jgi:hypothetical protein